MHHRFFSALAVCGLLALGAVPARAHHAVQAQYDFDKPIEFRGPIVKWSSSTRTRCCTSR